MKLKDKVEGNEQYQDEYGNHSHRPFRGEIVAIEEGMMNGYVVEGVHKGSKEKRKIWFKKDALKKLPNRVPKRNKK